MEKSKIKNFVQQNAVIETERLLLRRMNRDDFDAVAEIMRSESVQRVWEHYFTDEDVNQWIERRMKGYEENGIDYLLAVEKKSGRIVGQTGLLFEDLAGKNAWCPGWILKEDCHGLGYATEAARGIVNFAFYECGLDEICCDIRPENEKSIAVAERLGMTRCGSFVKHYRGMDMVHDIFKLEKERMQG